jgi:maleylacetoacetate isomerase
MTHSIVLYSNPISDCAARVRLALNLKNLAYKTVNIDLANQRNLDSEYVQINPSGTVPALVIYKSGVKGSVPDESTPRIILTQSIAAIEYLEEVFSDSRRLLPPLDSPLRRAHVRTLVEIISSDTHPLTSPRVSRFIQEKFREPFSPGNDDVGFGMLVKEWDKHWIIRGLTVYEKTLTSSEVVGRFSAGDEVTLADIVLVPTLWTAEEFGVDLDDYPRIVGIYGEMMKIEEVRLARQKGKGFE